MKVYTRQNGLLVAVCDKELIGKVLHDGDTEVKISPQFYKDELVGESEILVALHGAFAGNFFGERAVAVGVKSGLINKNSVKVIDGVPHAQFVRMDI